MAHSRSMEHAIRSWQMIGQIDAITWVLRDSDRELTQTDRNWLADFIEDKVKRPPRQPPFAHLLQGYRTLAIKAAENEVRRRVSEARAAGDRSRDLRERTISDVAAEYFERDWNRRGREDFEEALRTRLRRSARHSTTGVGC